MKRKGEEREGGVLLVAHFQLALVIVMILLNKKGNYTGTFSLHGMR